ncbi:MAG TPA: hypothetical protein ENI67_02635 [Gammaproteobacteria bacterium]|nr:hypothetical protein [Gammaproteobacteria bacterium]
MIFHSRILLLFLLLLPVKDALSAKQDYCSQGEGKTVLFLIDRTSTFDEQDKKNFANGVDVLFRQLQTGERLIIHTLTEDFSGSKKIFDACRPGCMEQGLVAGLFSQCRASRAKVDERKYIRDVLNSVKPMILTQEKYPNSEIIETIAFMMQEYEQHKPARLIIFSDMIEYSRLAKFAHLKEKNIQPLLDELDRLGLIRPMQGIEVEVLGFGRDHSAQRHGLKAKLKRNIEKFWQAYFKRARAERFHLGRNLNL